jgi:hypothetical protein
MQVRASWIVPIQIAIMHIVSPRIGPMRYPIDDVAKPDRFGGRRPCILLLFFTRRRRIGPPIIIIVVVVVAIRSVTFVNVLLLLVLLNVQYLDDSTACVRVRVLRCGRALCRIHEGTSCYGRVDLERSLLVGAVRNFRHVLSRCGCLTRGGGNFASRLRSPRFLDKV